MTIEMVAMLAAGIGIGWLAACLLMLWMIDARFNLKSKDDGSLHFTNVQIPKDAVITDAYVLLHRRRHRKE